MKAGQRTSATDEADAMGDPGRAGEDGSMLDAVGEAVAWDRPLDAVGDSAETLNDVCMSCH